MLAPDHRAVLLDHLRTPVGYKLDTAVATTFSLSFITALVAPVAFGAHEVRTEPDPIAILEAVRATTERLDIFYQGGQAQVPTNVPALVAMLEPMIHPVRRPTPGRLFHPKIWCLRYRAEGSPDLYRLLVLSRNLTDSRAWDTIVRFDGELGTTIQERFRPLGSLIRQLPNWALDQSVPRKRLERIRGLADDVERVNWKVDDPTVEDFRFFAPGVPSVDAVPDFSGHKHLVISPFINGAGLELIAGPGHKDLQVVSRAESLDALDDKHRALLKDTAYIMSPDTLMDSDTASRASDGDRIPEHSGLHAKVTVIDRHHGNGKWTSHVFSGSANATSSAYGGNVEFLVELIGKKKHLGITEQFLGEKGPFRNLLTQYEPADEKLSLPEEEVLFKLENLLRGWAEIPVELVLSPTFDAWDLDLRSERPIKVPRDHLLEISLLSHPGPRHRHNAGTVEIQFQQVPLVNVSSFIVFRVTDADGVEAATVMQASLVNDDQSRRLDEILLSQVNSREKFLRYLFLLLGLDDADAAVAGGGASWGAQSALEKGLASGTGLLELMLNVTAKGSTALTELNSLVERLEAADHDRDQTEKVLPEGFVQLWRSVRQAERNLRGIK